MKGTPFPGLPVPEENITQKPSPQAALDHLVELAARTLAVHKAIDPIILVVKEMCAFADYFVVASGTSRRHVQALAEHLDEALAQAGRRPLGREGMEEGTWVLLDYNEVVIHIFLQPFREFYDLEGLWAEAPRIPVPQYLAAALQAEPVSSG